MSVAGEPSTWCVGVVIPAQNEQATIERCIRSVLRSCDASARCAKVWIVIVADHCTDATEHVARRELQGRGGSEIDADPADAARVARSRALKVRHLVERWCTEVLDRFGRATGPQLLAFDGFVARQYAALCLHIRQCHGERDLEAILG